MKTRKPKRKTPEIWTVPEPQRRGRDWGRGTAAHCPPACSRRYFKPASLTELDGVSWEGGEPDGNREGGRVSEWVSGCGEKKKTSVSVEVVSRQRS